MSKTMQEQIEAYRDALRNLGRTIAETPPVDRFVAWLARHGLRLRGIPPRD